MENEVDLQKYIRSTGKGLINSVFSIVDESHNIAADVISGKSKYSRIEILSRGGPGISRRTKLIAKIAKKKIDNYMSKR